MTQNRMVLVLDKINPGYPQDLRVVIKFEYSQTIFNERIMQNLSRKIDFIEYLLELRIFKEF